MVVAVASAVDEQRLAALARANAVRGLHARVKRELRDGERVLADVLVDPECGRMRVGDVLLAVRGVGKHKAEAVLRRSRVSLLRPLGELTDRERRELLARLAVYERVRERLGVPASHGGAHSDG